MSKNKTKQEIKQSFIVDLTDGNRSDHRQSKRRTNAFGEPLYEEDPLINKLKAIGGVLKGVYCLLILYGLWYVFSGAGT